MTKRITILGSTGSIGQNTLDIVRRSDAGTYKVVALTANSRVENLVAQVREFQPEFVALADKSRAEELTSSLRGIDVEVGFGRDGLLEAAARQVDFTMAAIIGSAGLEPTLEAVKQGHHLGLANKECLVCAGEIFMNAVQQYGTKLLPVDSEHNAIFQVLEDDPEGIRRLILTASGGPFRETSLEALRSVTREDALNHPVWSMGAKISIDSATLMNKGLELIEASWLFDRPSKDIDVIVHPQSIIHSMVEYIDGSVLAQLGSPDMRTPIAYAMGWPERIAAPVERLDFTKVSGLTFFEPDLEKFPALRLAREALEAGGQAPCVLNAANEQAVAAFLDRKLSFLGISQAVETALEIHARESVFCQGPACVDSVISLDQAARRTVDEHFVNL